MRLYQIVPHDLRLRCAVLGAWIKGYKQLLREILSHVPDDCQIDPEVVRVSRWPDSLEGRQRLSEIRSRTTSPPHGS